MQVRGRYDNGANDTQAQSPGQVLMSEIQPIANATAATTALSAAEVLSGLILRSGPGAGFADTLPTVDALLAAAPNLSQGDSFTLLLQNTSGFTDTIATAADNSWTLQGTTTVATNQTREYLITITSAARTRIIATAATTNGSANVTGLSDADVKYLVPGMLVTGTGIPGSTTILAVNATLNSMTLSANATATNNPVALTCVPTATIRGVRTSAV